MHLAFLRWTTKKQKQRHFYLFIDRRRFPILKFRFFTWIFLCHGSAGTAIVQWQSKPNETIKLNAKNQSGLFRMSRWLNWQRQTFYTNWYKNKNEIDFDWRETMSEANTVTTFCDQLKHTKRHLRNKILFLLWRKQKIELRWKLQHNFYSLNFENIYVPIDRSTDFKSTDEWPNKWMSAHNTAQAHESKSTSTMRCFAQWNKMSDWNGWNCVTRSDFNCYFSLLKNLDKENRVKKAVDHRST